jgi:hypothetical protein
VALGNHYAGCAPATAEEAARVRTEKEAANRQLKITDIPLRSRLTDPDIALAGNIAPSISKPLSSSPNPPQSPSRTHPLPDSFP